jgi:hypothetical protein
MNLRSAAVTNWKQKPKPESVHDQMNNPAAALPSTSITSDQAAQMIADATRIRAVLGCK